MLQRCRLSSVLSSKALINWPNLLSHCVSPLHHHLCNLLMSLLMLIVSMTMLIS
jgi:hypothetical protein